MAIINRFVLIASKHGGNSVVPAISVTDGQRGNGLLVNAGKRALVGASTMALLDAFMAREGAHYTAKDHGLRLMIHGNSPAFMETVGMGTGTLFVYKGANKRAALDAAFAKHGVPTEGMTTRVSVKDGSLYVTFPRPLSSEEASNVWDVLCAPDFTSAGGGNGYQADPRLGTECEDVALEAAPVDVPQASASVEGEDKPAKGKRGRPKGAAKAKADAKMEAASAE